MSSTRKLSSRLTQLLELFNRNDDWLIVINADPDAMASAMALKRIMSHRTGKVTIARINEISRPDNLAMIRYLRIPMLPLTDKLKASCSHFAMVDSQPHHNPAFAGIPFSIVIDHHPAVPEHPVDAAYVGIRPIEVAKVVTFLPAMAFALRRVDAVVHARKRQAVTAEAQRKAKYDGHRGFHGGS